MAFVEESIGERRLRASLCVTTFACGVALSVTEVLTGDIATGISFNLISGSTTVTGRY
jgi:hypothetical protein